jgi:alkylation response protein AidB-like acyl-CoA dehydrogenase
MANFFTDNEDLLFLFDHLDLAALAELQEDHFANASCGGSEAKGNACGAKAGTSGAKSSACTAEEDFAPIDAADAVDNYRRILRIVGDVAANHIAPRSEQVDHEGNILNDDGTVTYGSAVQQNLDVLSQADLMGFTLPRQYGGLNCPTTLYTMAIEIISRADCSLMNIFGLQGIAETINAFANDEIKHEYLPRFCRTAN